jgi:hypothetical protein
MDPPVKLLTNGQAILNFMKEKKAIDTSERTEVLMKKGDKLATQVMTLENASEIARLLLQADGVFEKISEEIIKECQCNTKVNYACTLTNKNLTSKRTGIEIIHLGTQLNKAGDGHYVGAIVNHRIKNIYISDSMGKLSGETPVFINYLKRHFNNYNIKNETNITGYQPTGGFYPKTISQLKLRLAQKNIKINDEKYLDQIFEISQYDELAQHHFCYIESFVYMCHRLLGTPMGPTQPRERIVFIKKVIWGLVHKFGLLNKKNVSAPVKTYFERNFPWYLKFTAVSGSNITLRSSIFHIPNLPLRVKRTDPVPKIYATQLVRIPVKTSSTIKQIIQDAA